MLPFYFNSEREFNTIKWVCPMACCSYSFTKIRLDQGVDRHIQFGDMVLEKDQGFIRTVNIFVVHSSY